MTAQLQRACPSCSCFNSGSGKVDRSLVRRRGRTRRGGREPSNLSNLPGQPKDRLKPRLLCLVSS
ncbi:hypothetical protein RUM43_004664, partial [Polyplax serrata]